MEEDGVVRFPDAPSERAVKHVQELKKARKAGYEAYVLFVIQMKGVRYFTPNMADTSGICGSLTGSRGCRSKDPGKMTV